MEALLWWESVEGERKKEAGRGGREGHGEREVDERNEKLRMIHEAFMTTEKH